MANTFSVGGTFLSDDDREAWSDEFLIQGLSEQNALKVMRFYAGHNRRSDGHNYRFGSYVDLSMVEET